MPKFIVVGVAQLVEHQVVALEAEGSNPFTHPLLYSPRSILFLTTSCGDNKNAPTIKW